MYGKIFESFFDSSLCQNENYATRLVFIYFCTKMDQEGYVHCPNAGVLARRAHVTVEEAEKALEILSGPDPESTNPSNEGRRIEKMPGGYLVLNGPYYRSLKNMEESRRRTRERVAKHREQKKSNEKALQPVTRNKNVTPSSASASDSKEEKKSVRRKETNFRDSPVFEFGKFREGLKDWPLEQVEFYYKLFSLQEKYKYQDWCLTARRWELKESWTLRVKRENGKKTNLVQNPKEEKIWASVPDEVKEQLIKDHTPKN